MNASLFVLLFVLLLLFLVLILFFVFLGGQGVGVGFGGGVFGGGAEIQRKATLSQSIALRSAIVGRENFDRRWFICFVLFFCLFVFLVFILFLLFFRGRGLVELFWGWWTGYRLSQLCSEHCITENFSAISFSVCFAFCCGLVCFFKPLQYFGAPEN